MDININEKIASCQEAAQWCPMCILLNYSLIQLFVYKQDCKYKVCDANAVVFHFTDHCIQNLCETNETFTLTMITSLLWEQYQLHILLFVCISIIWALFVVLIYLVLLQLNIKLWLGAIYIIKNKMFHSWTSESVFNY